MICFCGLLTTDCILLCSSTFAKQMKIPASVMRECAFEKDFKQCCFSKAIVIDDTDIQNTNETPNNPGNPTQNNNQQNENPPSSNYTPNTLHYGSGPIDKYNKYFPTHRPLFDYYESHLIKKCEDVGHWYQSPNYPDYKYCVCDNGGDFDGTDCYCYGWTENGQCSCPIGTTKYVFKTGPEENIDSVNCRSLDHINDWGFSKPDNWTQRPYFRNNLNNENAEDEFWDSLTEEQKTLLIHVPRLPGYEELSAYRKTLIRDDIWKAWGIKAKKGFQTVKFDVVGTSKCIDTFANLDVESGSECVCSILSVSKGKTPKFWAYNPTAHFYVGFYANMTKDEICESECAQKCGQAFSSDDYNLRHILLNWWSPN